MLLYSRSRNSSVSVVISYKLDNPGFQIPEGKIFVSSLKCPDRLQGPFLGVKQLGHEFDGLPSSGAEIKNQ